MSIYQHFRREEREFIDQVLSWQEHVSRTYSPKLTDFLDPREKKILQMILGNQSEVRVQFFGGVEEAERCRALLYPEYYQVDEKDFEIHLFEIMYPTKFMKIQHPQVLGSLMSLGIRRGKFGDILISDDRVQFFVSGDIREYLTMQLTKIGSASISLKELPISEALTVEQNLLEISMTVSSLRLDAVCACVYNVSRQSAQDLIKQGHVKVNWTTIENPSFICEEADILSARGYGRGKIISIEGKTKKDKWRIQVGKQK